MTKILLKHNICGHKWEIKPNSFMNGNRCPICSSRKISHKEFVNQVCDKYNNEYTVLGEYINSNEKVLIRHNKCNYEWEVNTYHFINGHGCPKCAGKLPYTTETFKEKVCQMYGDEYNVLGEYIPKTKILMQHNICNHIYLVAPNNFIKGYRCPKCFRNFPFTTEEYKKKVYDLVEDEYEVLEDYKNNHTKILMKHNICNHIYRVRPNDFLGRHVRCPQCNESKGESKIKNFLKNNNIKFQPQYIFNNLLSDLGNPLRFDFGVLNNDNNLKFLIEYDGQQHFEWIKGWIPKNKFIKTQYHDQMKNNYCQTNNISLLRIPYWEYDNIETILTNYLMEV